MAIAFDSFSSAEGYATNALAFDHTVHNTGSVLIVCVTTNGVNPSVTYRGAAMTLAGKRQSAFDATYWSYAFYLLAPRVGGFTQTILVSTSGTPDIFATAASYSGCRQVSQPDNFASSGSSVVDVPTLTRSLTSVADNCWMLMFVADQRLSIVSADVGSTKRGACPTRSCSFFDSGAPITPAGANSMAVITDQPAWLATILTLTLVPTAPGTPVTLTAAQGQTATLDLQNVPGVALTAAQGQTATLARQYAVGSVLSATQGQTATLARTITNPQVWPRSDRVTGGATITIKGVGFVFGAIVTMDGVACVATFVSSSRMTAVVPAHAAGVASLLVTNPDATVFSVSFTYYALALSDTALQIAISGVIINMRIGSLSISETRTTKTCSFALDSLNATTPLENAPVRIGVGSLADDDVIFNGKIEKLTVTGEEGKTNVSWYVSCVGETYQLKRRLVWGTWTEVPADSIAASLLAYARGVTGVNIQGNLPSVSVTYNGVYLQDALQTLADLIVGSQYIDDVPDLHLFQTEALLAPDPIDASNLTLRRVPALKCSRDAGQLRNRIIVIGGGSSVSFEVIDPSLGWIPVADAVPFTTPGRLVDSQGNVRSYGGPAFGGGQTVTNGITAIGATTLVVVSAAGTFPYSGSLAPLPSGGWVMVGSQPIYFTDIDGTWTILQGVPASGQGSVTATIPSGTPVVGLSSLFTGAPHVASGSVNLYEQRDNVPQQLALAAAEGLPSDGVVEFKLNDSSLLTRAACVAAGDAMLATYDAAVGLASNDYDTTDKKSKVGRTVHVVQPYGFGMFDPAMFDPAIYDLYAPAIGGPAVGDFLIQSLSISVDENMPPVYKVKAADIKPYQLADFIRQSVLLR